METKKKLLIGILAFLLTTVGCRSLERVFTPSNPPLREGEVPWVLQPGTYVDAEGVSHVVTVDNQRWSVSQAYIFDSIVNTKNVKTSQERIKMTGIGVILLIILGSAGLLWKALSSCNGN